MTMIDLTYNESVVIAMTDDSLLLRAEDIRSEAENIRSEAISAFVSAAQVGWDCFVGRKERSLLAMTEGFLVIASPAGEAIPLSTQPLGTDTA
jgi:hypothetical protein